MTKKLEVSDLVFDYENRKILNHLDFSVNEGEFVSILGPSGCGKSTTGKLIDHLITPDTGEIWFEGKDISKISDNEMRPLR